MKRFSALALLAFLIISCNSNTPKKGNVTVSGVINGLKKGTLFLQKIKDTTLITIDSVLIEDNAEFVLKSDISEPEIHYLFLEKNDGAEFNDRIDFFAEPGNITITTSVSDFEKDARIKGGKNQKKYQEYKKMNQRFNNLNLKIIKENFEATKQNDQEKLIANDEKYKKLVMQKYLYTINFAVNNKKLAVAPYVTLNEVFDANIKYLDTVANSLSDNIKKSLYGKQLIELIKNRKETENVQ